MLPSCDLRTAPIGPADYMGTDVEFVTRVENVESLQIGFGASTGARHLIGRFQLFPVRHIIINGFHFVTEGSCNHIPTLDVMQNPALAEALLQLSAAEEAVAEARRVVQELRS